MQAVYSPGSSKVNMADLTGYAMIDSLNETFIKHG
jgi:hypothetical protein